MFYRHGGLRFTCAKTRHAFADVPGSKTFDHWAGKSFCRLLLPDEPACRPVHRRPRRSQGRHPRCASAGGRPVRNGFSPGLDGNPAAFDDCDSYGMRADKTGLFDLVRKKVRRSAFDEKIELAFFLDGAGG